MVDWIWLKQGLISVVPNKMTGNWENDSWSDSKVLWRRESYRGEIIQCPLRTYLVSQTLSSPYICVVPAQSEWSLHKCMVENNLRHWHVMPQEQEIIPHFRRECWHGSPPSPSSPSFFFSPFFFNDSLPSSSPLSLPSIRDLSFLSFPTFMIVKWLRLFT